MKKLFTIVLFVVSFVLLVIRGFGSPQTDPFVGSIVFAQEHQCTATRIDKNQVVTASHCISLPLWKKYSFRTAKASYELVDYYRFKNLNSIVFTIRKLSYTERSNARDPDTKNENSDDSTTKSLYLHDGKSAITKVRVVDLQDKDKHGFFSYKSDTKIDLSGAALVKSGSVLGIHVGHNPQTKSYLAISLDKILSRLSEVKSYNKNSHVFRNSKSNALATKPIDIDPIIITPGRPTEEGRPDGDCHGGGCGNGGGSSGDGQNEKPGGDLIDKPYGGHDNSHHDGTDRQELRRKALIKVYTSVRSSLAQRTYPFKGISKSSTEGRKLAELQKKYLRAQTKAHSDQSSTRPLRFALIDIGFSAKTTAYQSYKSGNNEDGDIALKISTEALDMALSATPYVGFGKDVYEAIYGVNFLTGQKQQTLDRVVAVVGVVIGVATLGTGSSGWIKFASKTFGVLKKVGARLAKGIPDVVTRNAGRIFRSAKKYGLQNSDQVKNVAELSGKAKIENLDTFLSTAARNSDGAALIFKADKAVEHFAKHGNKMKNALGKSSYSLKEYMLDAHHVVKNGQYAPEVNGYVRLIGGQGSAKAAFVGMTKDGKNLTTMHVKTVAELKKKAPSLGWE